MKLKDMTDEQRAVKAARSGKEIPGAFYWMVERKYLTRNPASGQWHLNDAGHAWLEQWKNWKP